MMYPMTHKASANRFNLTRPRSRNTNVQLIENALGHGTRIWYRVHFMTLLHESMPGSLHGFADVISKVTFKVGGSTGWVSSIDRPLGS